MSRLTCLSLVVLCATAGRAADETITIEGRVLDQDGKPVSGAHVAPFWSANGLWWKEVAELRERQAWSDIWSREGHMRPWGTLGTTTDETGRFSLETDDDHFKVLAYDLSRHMAGIGLLDATDAERDVTVRLQPLVRFSGEVRHQAASRRPAWCGAVLSLKPNPDFPLGIHKVAMCGSFRGRFEFHVPPGDYLLRAYNDTESEPNAETPGEIPVRLAGDETAYDAGTVELERRPTRSELLAKSRREGSWQPLEKRYGQPAPALHFNDADGVAHDFELKDLRGRWVLVYFWGPWCRPCLKTGLPKLMAFQKAHTADAGRFQIITVCLEHDGEIKSIRELNELLAPVVKNVWKQDLPFPVLLDSSIQTSECWGVEGVGSAVLVDPTGRLVEGDEAILAQKLSPGRGDGSTTDQD